MASHSSPSPDEVLSSIRIGEDIQKALIELPFEFREAVVFCDIIGMSYLEIADALDVPVGTVRSRIHRGRRLLRERLG
jgi:RNA polymerase sigma-70 factor (ECF subfamily)